MKRFFWTMLATSIALTMILAACSASPSVSPASATSPAMPKTNNVAPSVDVVAASAVIRPEHQVKMGFGISAPVSEILVKEGDTVKAGQPLMVLSTLDLELAVQEAEWSVRSAEALLDRARDPYKKIFSDGKVLYAAGYVEKRNEMEARLQAAQAELDAAKYKLTQGTLLAPFDSTVVDVNIEPGELAQAGQVTITLADLANMQVETTDLSERDVPSIKPGQTVNVYIEALDITVAGEVTKVFPVSDTVGGDVVYPIAIKLDEQPAGLLWGMSAEVEIKTK